MVTFKEKFLKTFGKWMFIIFGLFTGMQVSAQSYLEFIENKGQWDKQIRYKGDLTTGAFALKADGGYRLLLYDANDIAALARHQKHDEIAASADPEIMEEPAVQEKHLADPVLISN